MDRDLLVPALSQLLASVPETAGRVQGKAVPFEGAGTSMEGYSPARP